MQLSQKHCHCGGSRCCTDLLQNSLTGFTTSGHTNLWWSMPWSTTAGPAVLLFSWQHYTGYPSFWECCISSKYSTLLAVANDIEKLGSALMTSPVMLDQTLFLWRRWFINRDQTRLKKSAPWCRRRLSYTSSKEQFAWMFSVLSKAALTAHMLPPNPSWESFSKARQTSSQPPRSTTLASACRKPFKPRHISKLLAKIAFLDWFNAWSYPWAACATEQPRSYARSACTNLSWAELRAALNPHSCIKGSKCSAGW